MTDADKKIEDVGKHASDFLDLIDQCGDAKDIEYGTATILNSFFLLTVTQLIRVNEVLGRIEDQISYLRSNDG